jgi:hypothetical protein
VWASETFVCNDEKKMPYDSKELKSAAQIAAFASQKSVALSMIQNHNNNNNNNNNN